MSKNKWDRRRYQELIDIHKALSLLSLEEISAVLVNRLPSILSIHYFTLFLYDKDKRELSLLCHNHPKIENSFSLPLSNSPVMEAAVLSGQYVLEQNFRNSRYYREFRKHTFQKEFFRINSLNDRKRNGRRIESQ